MRSDLHPVSPPRRLVEHGKRIDLVQALRQVKITTFESNVSIKWFEDGETNVCFNCIDRHLKHRGATMTALHTVAIVHTWAADIGFSLKPRAFVLAPLLISDAYGFGISNRSPLTR